MTNDNNLPRSIGAERPYAYPWDCGSLRGACASNDVADRENGAYSATAGNTAYDHKQVMGEL